MGASAVLVFQLAALIGLRWNEEVRIRNHPAHVIRSAAQVDDQRDMHEHPGYLIITGRRRELLLAGDGRVLKPAGCESLWERYMAGESRLSLLRFLETSLGLL
jgi:hypothetical protein